MELPPELNLLLGPIQQQIAESNRQAQLAYQNCENLRGYTLTQVDQLRALIAQTQDQNRVLVEQAIEKARIQSQKDWDVLRSQVGGEIQYVNDDIHELKQLLTRIQEKDLKEIRDLISSGNKEGQEKQADSYKRIIATQGAILFFLFTTAIGILVKLIWHV